MTRNGKPIRPARRAKTAVEPRPPALDYSKPLPPYLDGRELAALVHSTKRTLERWRSTGAGPPFSRVGGKVLYSRDVVLAWIKSTEATSTSAP